MPKLSLPDMWHDVQRGNWDGVRANLHDEAYRTRFILQDSIFRTGRTPLHYLCTQRDVPVDILRELYDLDKPALYTTDRLGNSALHGACCAKGTAKNVSMLLELEAKAGAKSIARRLGTRYRGDGRYTPLEMTWLEHLKWSQDRWRNIIYLGDVQHIDDLTRGDLYDLWEKTFALVWGTSFQNCDMNILHAIARCGGSDLRCPAAAMWLALKLYRNQAGQRNFDGSLPLHIAASNPAHNALDIEYSEGPVLAAVYLSQMNQPVVDMLVLSYPRAAKIPNRQGRLPLNLAIESGKSWEGGVRSLLRAAPEALKSRDTLTHLYPFMLAACSKESSINVVYSLLRAGPELLK